MSSQSRSEAAFDAYLALGPERSLALLQTHLRRAFRRPPTLRTLENWSTRYGWQQRLRDVERQARERAEREHIEWVQQHRERLRNEVSSFSNAASNGCEEAPKGGQCKRKRARHRGRVPT
ncbi:MAG: hypothetical protein IPF51_03690 [Dehalococcoidia bacterium]|nr:hypothetical protein [Dehalococcoidia bacterium]